MAGADTHAVILRTVAVAAVVAARTAWREAQARPSEGTLRAALRACVLATRTLRRASAEHPDEEQEMLERAALLDETAVGLKLRLVRLVELEPPRA